jgi:amidophosphoribosyltransferase
MNTACGVLGIITTQSVMEVSDVIESLRGLQHRGYHSWGIASLEDGRLKGQVSAGMLPDRTSTIRARPMRHGLGHVGHDMRVVYNSGTGARERQEEEALSGQQPVLVNSERGEFAIAFNGRLGHVHPHEPEEDRVRDIYRISAGIAKHPSKKWLGAIHDAMASCVAAYAVIIMTSDGVYYARDVHGYRPMAMAEITAHPRPIPLSQTETSSSSSDDSSAGANTSAVSLSTKPVWKAVVVASESIATDRMLDRLRRRHPTMALRIRHRSVEPGTIGHVCLDGTWREWRIKCPQRGGLDGAGPLQRCALEAVHFMRGGAEFDEVNLDYFREECGRMLAEQDRDERWAYDPSSTLVVGCPRAGITAGRGYAAAACLPYVQVVRATSKVLRSPRGSAESRVVRRRKERPTLAVHRDEVIGKTVILVDDLVVSASTVTRAVSLLREAGAGAIHVRVAAPAIRRNCVWGTMLPDMEDLFAANGPLDPACMGATSLKYLSDSRFDLLIGDGFCKGCLFRDDSPTHSDTRP